MTKRRMLVGMAASALAASAIYTAWSQESGKPAAQAAGPAKTAQEAKKPKKLDIKYATFDHDSASDVTDFTDAIMTDVEEGTVFHADKMKVDQKKSIQTAEAVGNLTVTDKQADVTGEKVVIYFAKSKRLAVVTGSVVILVKPKSEQKDPTAPTGPMPVALQNGKAQTEEPKNPDDEASAADSRKHPATITCDKLDYEYGKDRKHAVLTGHFKVVQKLTDHTRTLYAEHADWYGLEDRLLLHGPVRWEDTKDNQKGETPGDVTVFTKEGEERIKMGPGKFTTEVHDEDEEPAAGAKPGAKPPAATPDKKTAAPPKPGVDKKAQP